MANIAAQTLASLVTQNHQTVAVLEKYHLDFCCKGKRTLSQACTEKGISLETILEELQISTAAEVKSQMPFNQMSAEKLIGYILINHHFYVKQTMPTILGHVEKVATKHFDRFPYMIKVFQLFTLLVEEMTSHMQKEEDILFRRIKEIERSAKENTGITVGKEDINNIVNAIETEHDQAGEIMYEIRRLTNNYTVPDDACTTFKVSLAELKEFEEDLHRHVHLENNILFPLAEKLSDSIK